MAGSPSRKEGVTEAEEGGTLVISHEGGVQNARETIKYGGESFF
jgi:hypothetical protein